MAPKPRFGIDAPPVVLGFALGGPALLALGWLPILAPPLAWTLRITGAILIAEAAWMIFSSCRGKPALIRRLVANLHLAADATVLDVGCGRGMLLLELARHVPQGHAVGIDLWRQRDQSGNAMAVTLANARAAGLADHVQVATGDMRELPWPDAPFDAVTASLAIHNLATRADRDRAVREIARVLRPGGHVALLDFCHTRAYAATLRDAGLLDVRRRGPDLRMFPWVWTVTARRPGRAA